MFHDDEFVMMTAMTMIMAMSVIMMRIVAVILNIGIYNNHPEHLAITVVTIVNIIVGCG